MGGGRWGATQRQGTSAATGHGPLLLPISLSINICNNKRRTIIRGRLGPGTIIVTLPRLPPTHLEYSFVDSLAFRLRGFDLGGLAVTNVSRIGCGRLDLSYSTRFGGSGIRRTEAGSFGRLEVTNVSRIVALGGSICRIQRGLEGRGGPISNEAKDPGGSA